MVKIRSEAELTLLREVNRLVGDVLVQVADQVEPGVTTGDLDAEAERLIRDAGAVPAFLGYRGYPKTACISVDDEVVHGIPGRRKLRKGEIVSIDVGAKLNGFFGDAALSVPCGKVNPVRRKLLRVTDKALAKGIAAARAGNHVEDIGRAVQTTCEQAGFSVVRVFVGHGIGSSLHEEPQIPNFVVRNEPGPRLKAGMVLAIEPMVNAGVSEVRVLDDGWTAVTADGKPSAHFEHTIVVRDGAPEILSATPRRFWGGADSSETGA